MRVLVWGMGHVGAVTAACLAHLGHDVIGVERDEARRQAIEVGSCLTREPGLDDLVVAAIEAGRLGLTSDGEAAVGSRDVSLVCVDTPTDAGGGVRLDDIVDVAKSIDRALKPGAPHVVALRSTVAPGTARDVVAPLLDVPARLVVNPEFLREGHAVDEFLTPPYVLIGEIEPWAGSVVAELYRRIDAPVRRVPIEVAELLKLVTNSFHALKAGFANEVGRICEKLGLDAGEVMDLVRADSRLNASGAYLRPGPPFGGPCLERDLRTLVNGAGASGASVPILESVLPSNGVQLDATRLQIEAAAAEHGRGRVGFLGLGFKAGTGDPRGSRFVELARVLLEEGFPVLLHDQELASEPALHAALGSLRELLVADVGDLVDNCDVAVLCHPRADYVAAVCQARSQGAAVVDLTAWQGDV